MLVLIVVRGPGKGQVIRIADRERWIIGRMREEGQRIVWVPDTKASRRHAELVWRDGVWYLRDTGSTNGTYINHQLLVDNEEPRALHDGDQIAIGATVMVVGYLADTESIVPEAPHAAAAPAAPAAPPSRQPVEEPAAAEQDEALVAPDEEVDVPAPPEAELELELAEPASDAIDAVEAIEAVDEDEDEDEVSPSEAAVAAEQDEALVAPVAPDEEVDAPAPPEAELELELAEPASDAIDEVEAIEAVDEDESAPGGVPADEHERRDALDDELREKRERELDAIDGGFMAVGDDLDDDFVKQLEAELAQDEELDTLRAAAERQQLLDAQDEGYDEDLAQASLAATGDPDVLSEKKGQDQQGTPAEMDEQEPASPDVLAAAAPQAEPDLDLEQADGAVPGPIEWADQEHDEGDEDAQFAAVSAIVSDRQSAFDAGEVKLTPDRPVGGAGWKIGAVLVLVAGIIAALYLTNRLPGFHSEPAAVSPGEELLGTALPDAVAQPTPEPAPPVEAVAPQTLEPEAQDVTAPQPAAAPLEPEVALPTPAPEVVEPPQPAIPDVVAPGTPLRSAEAAPASMAAPSPQPVAELAVELAVEPAPAPAPAPGPELAIAPQRIEPEPLAPPADALAAAQEIPVEISGDIEAGLVEPSPVDVAQSLAALPAERAGEADAVAATDEADDLLDHLASIVEHVAEGEARAPAGAPTPTPSPVDTATTAATAPSGDGTGRQPASLEAAGKITFLIDASGSQVDTLPMVLERVNRTIAMLHEHQQFTIIFFQGDRVIEVPPVGLKLAQPDVKREVEQWLNPSGGRILAMGASNPAQALRLAVAYKPDQMIIYSDRVAGARAGEVEQKEILALLDHLDPARRIQINGVQFFYEDPRHTLRLITERHHGTFEFIAQSRHDSEAGLNLEALEPPTQQ